MISYIVATNDRAVLEANLLASLRLQDDDELITMEDPPSIAVAYNQGAADARNPIRCYVHADVQITDPAKLRSLLIRHCTPSMGMVGVVGGRDRVVPWWDGRKLGSVIDARANPPGLDFGPGGYCAYLDGLLLATAQHVEWDESYPGFHGYDHDVCEQMLQRDLPNFCLTGGASMVAHNTTNPKDMAKLTGWDDVLARFKHKWDFTEVSLSR